MITSRNCVACGSSVKGFADCPVVRHCTSCNPSGSVYNDFGCQYVSGSCSNGSNVLIRFRDGLYGNVRQTVISFVSSNWLLRLCWSNGLALQVIVSTASYTGYSTGTIVVTFRNPVCFPFFYARLNRPVVSNIADCC